MKSLNSGRKAYKGNCGSCGTDKTYRWYLKAIPNKVLCASCYGKFRLSNPEIKEKRIKQREQWGLKNRFRVAKNTALRKGEIFTLSQEDFYLTANICFYCNKDNTANMGVGLDRIDNNLGYTKENSVGCCRQCNVAKNNYSLEEFKSWITKVYTKFKETNE